MTPASPSRRRHRLLCPAHLRAGRDPRCRRHRARYNSLAQVERAFRSSKTVDLDTAWFFHLTAPRVRARRLPLPTRLSPRMAPASGPRPDAVRRRRPRRRRGWTRLSRGQGPARRRPRAQGREESTDDDMPVHSSRFRSSLISCHVDPAHRPLLGRYDTTEILATPTHIQCGASHCCLSLHLSQPRTKQPGKYNHLREIRGKVPLSRNRR